MTRHSHFNAICYCLTVKQRHNSPRNPQKATRKCERSRNRFPQSTAIRWVRTCFDEVYVLHFCSLEPPTRWGPPQGTRRPSWAARSRRNGIVLAQKHAIQFELAWPRRGDYSNVITTHSYRTEAASSILMKSAVRQRSYVLSAAKKYEYVCLMSRSQMLILTLKLSELHSLNGKKCFSLTHEMLGMLKCVLTSGLKIWRPKPL